MNFAYKPDDSDGKTCFLTSSRNDFDSFDKERCLRVLTRSENVLVVGDSMANDMMPGLRAVFPTVNFLQATSSGCRPLVDAQGQRRCLALIKYIYDEFVPTTKLDAIIVSARWKDDDLDALVKTIQEIEHFVGRVVIFGPHVEYSQPLPRLLAMALIHSDQSIIAKSREVAPLKRDKLFSDRVRASGAAYFSLIDATCPHGVCVLEDSNGKPLQWDYGHFTPSGSKMVVNSLNLGGKLMSSLSSRNTDVSPKLHPAEGRVSP
jgi:hypothetical protein